MKTNYKISGIAIFALFLGLFSSLSFTANAQTVKHPTSELSTAVSRYVYTYNLSATAKKEIRYLIVIDANGAIKTCFDACDVCYPYDKGYTQKTTQLVCNNCGNKFYITALGTQSSGGCWPAYLPHTSDSDSVSINIADLQSGAYLFPEIAVTSVIDCNPSCSKDSSSMSIYCSQNIVNVKCANQSPRTCQVLDIDGKVCKTFSNSEKEFTIDAAGLTCGTYILSVDEIGKKYSKLFYISK